ncbi:MAG: hypothetical protein A2987_00135 [Omnitrophica bacterium RIFCSPLOWO2_01_FULL_45_10]|nr:MAG: hypothetical protein A2987_00135 [Omnitrophica bacterium RIFCSPLOWO2_01_FULL_45_10]
MKLNISIEIPSVYPTVLRIPCCFLANTHRTYPKPRDKNNINKPFIHILHLPFYSKKLYHTLKSSSRK